MKFLKCIAGSVLIFGVSCSSAAATEYWGCDYPITPGYLWFYVEKDRVTEKDGDVFIDYKLLENSELAIVAARGRSYQNDPMKVAGSLLLIRKDTGQMLLVNGSFGTWNDRESGQCRELPNDSSIPKELPHTPN